ncbi:MAG: MarR family transcriptional regulator [Bacteroidaceae bacterium]
MSPKFDPDIHLVFAILNGRVSSAINKRMASNFKNGNIDITPEQWTVLLFLWEHDGVTQISLCKDTFRDKPSMTRLINQLEKKGLVIRVASKNDKRANHIFLTDKGRVLEPKVREVTRQTLLEGLDGLDNDVMELAQETLRVIFKNLT